MRFRGSRNHCLNHSSVIAVKACIGRPVVLTLWDRKESILPSTAQYRFLGNAGTLAVVTFGQPDI